MLYLELDTIQAGYVIIINVYRAQDRDNEPKAVKTLLAGQESLNEREKRFGCHLNRNVRIFTASFVVSLTSLGEEQCLLRAGSLTRC